MKEKEFNALKTELGNGENEKLKLLFKEYAGYCINTLVAQHSCSREDAEDIYMDAILIFRENIIAERVDFLTNLRGYLYAICKNNWLSRLKKEKRVNQAASELYYIQNHLNMDGNIDGLEYQDELKKLALEALKSLSENCRSLLTSFYFDKMNLEQIADKYGYGNSNVAKVSKARCFKKLLEKVKDLQQIKN